MKTLILSDLHLGTKASGCLRVLDDLRRLARQYDRVILNGDTLDRYEAPACEAHSEETVRCAQEALASRGGPPEILSGNHDPAISDQHFAYLPDAALLVFHGDCVQDGTHQGREDRLLTAHLQQQWRQRGGRPVDFHPLLPLHRQLQGAYLREHPMVREHRSPLHYLARMFDPPHKILGVLDYWRRAPGMVARLAATFDQPLKSVVVGHSHRPGCWRYGALTVFNTGSFMPLSQPFVIEVEGAEVRFMRLGDLLRSRRTVLLSPPVATAVR